MQSSVYSLSSTGSTGKATGRNGVYDYPTAQGLQEGRTNTLVNGSRTIVNHDVTAAAITTNASGPIGAKNKAVVATTTTKTGNGAGLIVKFTSTNTDPTQLAALTVIDGGEGYATSDTVEIDGYPGSVVTVTAA